MKILDWIKLRNLKEDLSFFLRNLLIPHLIGNFCQTVFQEHFPFSFTSGICLMFAKKIVKSTPQRHLVDWNARVPRLKSLLVRWQWMGGGFWPELVAQMTEQQIPCRRHPGGVACLYAICRGQATEKCTRQKEKSCTSVSHHTKGTVTKNSGLKNDNLVNTWGVFKYSKTFLLRIVRNPSWNYF